jgi:Tfp pilus assembly protein PilZ
MPVRCVTYDRIFSNYITNNRPNGILIKTQEPLFVGQEVKLGFNPEGFNEPLKIKGEVAHATRSGVGVEFRDVHPKLSEMMGLIIDEMDE